MAPNVVWFENTGAQHLQNQLFWRSSQKNVFMRKYLQKKWPENFSGKFEGIWAKILRTPQNLPAPTPMSPNTARLYDCLYPKCDTNSESAQIVLQSDDSQKFLLYKGFLALHQLIKRFRPNWPH